VTTRRADSQLPDRPKPVARDGTGNAVENHSLKPVRGVGQADPSPFSRQQPSDEIESRRQRIERAAYRLAQARGFAPGHELEDWLAAEREVDGAASEA
jgi:hypothetical protein